MSFTKKDLNYFIFLYDMGFVIQSIDSEGVVFVRDYKGSYQIVQICKGRASGFLKIDLGLSVDGVFISSGANTDLEYKENITREFDKYKKIIMSCLKTYSQEIHITGYLNEEVYDNYQNIAETIDFKPKNIDELNEYAIKLRDEGKLSFEDYVKIVASLYMVLLLDVYKFPELFYSYDKNNKINARGLSVIKNPSYEYTIQNASQYCKDQAVITPTIDAEKLWYEEIDMLTHKFFEKDEIKLDNYFINDIYDNYQETADSIDFKPKNIDELNEYAIKLRDEGKLSFEDYVKGISSLYIVLLLDVYKFDKVICFLNPKDNLLLKMHKQEINAIKEPLFKKTFENILEYRSNFSTINIIEQVSRLFYGYRYKLGHKNLNKIKL